MAFVMVHNSTSLPGWFPLLGADPRIIGAPPSIWLTTGGLRQPGRCTPAWWNPAILGLVEGLISTSIIHCPLMDI